MGFLEKILFKRKAPLGAEGLIRANQKNKSNKKSE